MAITSTGLIATHRGAAAPSAAAAVRTPAQALDPNPPTTGLGILGPKTTGHTPFTTGPTRIAPGLFGNFGSGAATMMPFSPLAIMLYGGGTGGELPPAALVPLFGIMFLIAGYVLSRTVVAEAVSSASLRIVPRLIAHRSLTGQATLPVELKRGMADSGGFSLTATLDYSRGLLTLAQADALYESSAPGAHAQAMTIYTQAQKELQAAHDVFHKTPGSWEAAVVTGEALGRIHLRLGNPAAAAVDFHIAATHYIVLGQFHAERAVETPAANDVQFQKAISHYTQAALLEMRVVSLHDRNDRDSSADAVLHFSHAIQSYKKIAGLAKTLNDTALHDWAVHNQSTTEQQLAEWAHPMLVTARSGPEGYREYQDWAGRAKFDAADWEKTVQGIAVPPWVPYAELAWLSADALTAQWNRNMERVFGDYEQTHATLRRLHEGIEALRAANHPAVTPVLMEIMKDWLKQIAPKNVEYHLAQIPDPHAELKELEDSARFYSSELEDPARFNKKVIHLVTWSTTALQYHDDPEAIVAQLIPAFSQWTDSHEEWCGTYVDVLLNNWRKNPELVWPVIGNVVAAHASRITNWQLAQIRSWAEAEPLARAAWGQIEAANPDIHLVR